MTGYYQLINKLRFYKNIIESLAYSNFKAKLFKNIHTYGMFIGYGRSGHSLVGSLLDAHENAIFSHELDVLRYFKAGLKKNQLFYLMLENSKKFTERGRTWTNYSYYINEGWQGKFNNLLVIGDKAGLESTHILKKYPDLVHRLEKKIKLPVKIIYIKRNPFDVITTKARRGNKVLREVDDNMLQEAMNIHFDLLSTISNLKKIYSEKILEISHEDLIFSPDKYLKMICDHLCLESSDHYIDSCRNIIFKKPHYSRFDVNWPIFLIERVEKEILQYDFLKNYSYE